MKHFENLTEEESLLANDFLTESQAYFDAINAVNTFEDFYELFTVLCAERSLDMDQKRKR